MGEIKLQNIENCRQMLDEVRRLYFKSFPPEEQRPWKSVMRLLQADSSAYDLIVVLLEGKFVGFITFWQFDEFCYVEHFAIESHLRGKGIGADAICHFVDKSDSPVVLEVELSDCGEVACRRIAFYQRNGFMAHSDFKYVQPSYGEGLPAVPLMLMTANAPDDFDLKNVAQILHREVYGVKS